MLVPSFILVLCFVPVIYFIITRYKILNARMSLSKDNVLTESYPLIDNLVSLFEFE